MKQMCKHMRYLVMRVTTPDTKPRSRLKVERDRYQESSSNDKSDKLAKAIRHES